MTNPASQQTAMPPRDVPQVTDAAPICCSPARMFGWSPPALPADTALKRRVDRMLPRSGISFALFFAVVVALLNVGLVLPTRLDLVAVGVASVAAGSWCSVNFWRCRHAHCVISGAGWLVLPGFSFFEAAVWINPRPSW